MEITTFKHHYEQGWILTQSTFTVDKLISLVKQTNDLFSSISHLLERVRRKLLTSNIKDKIHLTKRRSQSRTNKYIPISVLCVQRKSRETNSNLNICSVGIWSEARGILHPRTSLQDAGTSSTVLPLQKVPPSPWPTNSSRSTPETCFNTVCYCGALAGVKNGRQVSFLLCCYWSSCSEESERAH